MRFAAAILSTSFNFSVRNVSFRYFSIISDAMGAAHVVPKPEFSTTTAMAILGFSLGAKQTNIELSLSLILFLSMMRYFSAVPVFAQILIPGIITTLAVP